MLTERLSVCGIHDDLGLKHVLGLSDQRIVIVESRREFEGKR